MKLIRWVEVQLGRRTKQRKEDTPDTPRLLNSDSPHAASSYSASSYSDSSYSDSPYSDSPRPRCRIRTNPWLRWRPADCDSSLWEGDVDEDTPYCPAAYCRPIPRSAWIDFKDFQLLEKGDAADSGTEDYDSEGPIRSSQPPASPQADSACGSEPESSSCSSTPLCEGGPHEPLPGKVARLQRARLAVDRRLAEARAEEVVRREERLLLRRELAQFRRLLLLQTLTELRAQLEKKREDPPCLGF